MVKGVPIVQKSHSKETLQQQDDKYVWHSMKPYNPNATLVAEKAEGSWITDVAGNRYLDAMSGLWCVNVGYGRQELAEAAYEQLKQNGIFSALAKPCPSYQISRKAKRNARGGLCYLFLQ